MSVISHIYGRSYAQVWIKYWTWPFTLVTVRCFEIYIYLDKFCVSLAISWTQNHSKSKVKVKVTLVQALRLCTGRTVYRRSRGIALPFHNHGIRTGWGVSVRPRPLFTPGKDPVLIVQESGWAPGPVWTGTENLATTGIRSRTVQHVTSRYTDWAIPAHTKSQPSVIFSIQNAGVYAISWRCECSDRPCAGHSE